jgi:hypothetical protein
MNVREWVAKALPLWAATFRGLGLLEFDLLYLLLV